MGLDIYFNAKRKNEKLRKDYDEEYAKYRDAQKRYNDALDKEVEKIKGTTEPNQSDCFDLPKEVTDRV